MIYIYIIYFQHGKYMLSPTKTPTGLTFCPLQGKVVMQHAQIAENTWCRGPQGSLVSGAPPATPSPIHSLRLAPVS